MADIVPVLADIAVKPGSFSARVAVVQFGEAVTQGQPVYQNATTQRYLKADANDTAAKAEAKGICLTKVAADGDYGVIITAGAIDFGAALAVGQDYVVSTNAGGVAPSTDLGTGDYVTRLGTASAADTLNLDIQATGIQHA